MTVADYLVDASALARVLLRQNTAEWDDRIAAGLVAICDLTPGSPLLGPKPSPARQASRSAPSISDSKARVMARGTKLPTDPAARRSD